VSLALNLNFFAFVASTKMGHGAFLQGQLSMGGIDPRRILHELGEVLFGIGCFVTVNWLAGLERRHPHRLEAWPVRALASVGRVSYSIYLTHVPVLAVVDHLTGFGFGPAGWAAQHVAGVTGSLAAGYAFHHLVERWFLKRPRWLPHDRVEPEEHRTAVA
jgi:peptidoglycan/LPS O-acetylase OafA/YrhL